MDNPEPETLEHLRQRVQESLELACTAHQEMENGNATWGDYQRHKEAWSLLEASYNKRLEEGGDKQ